MQRTQHGVAALAGLPDAGTEVPLLAPLMTHLWQVEGSSGQCGLGELLLRDPNSILSQLLQ